MASSSRVVPTRSLPPNREASGSAKRLSRGIPAPAPAKVSRRNDAARSFSGVVDLHDLPEGLSGLVPTRLAPLARSSLLSPLGKARVALDYLLPARRAAGDESLGGFIRRRLGREAWERLVEPLMAGIYAADGDQLSLAATFPQLREAERRYGGLIKGVLAARRLAPASQLRAGVPVSYARRWSWRSGQGVGDAAPGRRGCARAR